MRKLLLPGVAAWVLLLVLVAPAGATTLTFDDISSSVFGSIPDGYGGLNWDGMGFSDGSSFPGSGYQNGRVSGTHVAFNELADTATVTGPTFNFVSAYLTAAWNNNLSVNVIGVLGATALYNQTVVVGPLAPTLVNFNFMGIDRLIFQSSGGTNAGLGAGGEHFVMDDFTFNRSGAVPDQSATLALLGLGMVALNALRRKLL